MMNSITIRLNRDEVDSKTNGFIGDDTDFDFYINGCDSMECCFGD